MARHSWHVQRERYARRCSSTNAGRRLRRRSEALAYRPPSRISVEAERCCGRALKLAAPAGCVGRPRSPSTGVSGPRGLRLPPRPASAAGPLAALLMARLMASCRCCCFSCCCVAGGACAGSGAAGGATLQPPPLGWLARRARASCEPEGVGTPSPSSPPSAAASAARPPAGGASLVAPESLATMLMICGAGQGRELCSTRAAVAVSITGAAHTVCNLRTAAHHRC